MAGNEYHCEYKQRRVEQGICPDCGRPNSTGRRVCGRCAGKARASAGALRERRRANGLCVRCGGEKDPSRATCDPCAEKRRQRRRQPAAPAAVRWNDPPQAGRYRTIVVDPPWPITRTKPRKTALAQGLSLDYPVMRIAQLRDIPVPEWAGQNAMLFLWVTAGRARADNGAPVIEEGFRLLRAWAFTFYTMLTWDKRTGVSPFGPFQWTTEHVLVAYRGRLVFNRFYTGRAKTCFTAPVRRHSEKPREFYGMIRALCEPPRLDVFARRRHEGFDGWGDEYEGSPHGA